MYRQRIYQYRLPSPSNDYQMHVRTFLYSKPRNVPFEIPERNQVDEMTCKICNDNESMISSWTCYSCLVKWKRAQNEMFELLIRRYGKLHGENYVTILNEMRTLVHLYHNDKQQYSIQINVLKNGPQYTVPKRIGRI